jgi:hypothetical protein
MTSFYGNFALNKNKEYNLSNTSTKNILKNDYTLYYTDFEKLKIAEQYNKLYSNIYETNKKNIEINENKKIYNLSLNELFKKSSTVYIKILNDLSVYFSPEQKDKSLNALGLIITQDDNLLFIGLFILIMSFFLWIIQVTS